MKIFASCFALVLALVAGGASAQPFDGWYRLQTQFRGDGECLEGDQAASTTHNGAAFMNTCLNATSQLWMLVAQGNGLYRLKTQFGGDGECLDGNQAGSSVKAGAAFMNTCQNVSSQLWMPVAQGNGFYRLKTQFGGDGACLEGNQAASPDHNGAAFMRPCMNQTGQSWKLVKQAVVAQCTNQSPRRLDNWNTENALPTIQRGANDNTVIYTPNGGSPTTLSRCGQHYHCEIENLQPVCPGQSATGIGGPPGSCPRQPPVGSWVEVHTVFSATVGTTGCDPETLDCCTQGPFVVLGYHAKVTADQNPRAVPVVWNPGAAEWTGSNTGPDDAPGQCKPLQVKWRFSLGCDSTLSLGQLGTFHHQDRARGLQSADRLSTDLNLLTH